MHTFLDASSLGTRFGLGVRLVALSLTMAMLSGCLGQNMSRTDTTTDEVVESGEVRMVEITPELVAGQSTATPTDLIPAELREYRPDTYRIQPGDMILVTVWDHPELTTPAGTMREAATNGRMVYPDGTMFYPYVGTIKVEGMSLQELRQQLMTRLGKYLRNPQLDLNVATHAGQVSLGGAFTNPAPQAITTVPLTVSKAVGAAGVNIDEADLSGLVLTREGRSYALDLDSINRRGAGEVYLKPGDSLYLPFKDASEIYVLGEVNRQGPVNFKSSGMSLTQALGRAGGLDQITSSGDSVYVIRGVDAAQLTASSTPPANATVYQLRARSASAFALADSFPMKAGDVVFVGAAGITRWNRFLVQLLPLTGIVRNAADVEDSVSD